MSTASRELRYNLLGCLLSLGLYAYFSRAFRVWAGGLSYTKSLLSGVASQFGQHSRLFYHAILSPAAWNGLDVLLLVTFIALCIAAAELTRRLLGGHLDVVPALVLFAFAWAVIPQMLLAFAFWPDGQGRITTANQIALLGFVIVVEAALLFRGWRLHRRKTPIFREESIGAWGYTFVAPAVLLLGIALILGLISVVGFDATAYHLPLAAKYRTTASITTDGDIQFAYPSNPELVIRWFLTSGNDHLANALSFLSAVFSLIVFYKIGLEIGQSREAAVVAASCVVAIPFFPYLATTAYTDLCCLMLILLSVLYLCKWWNTGWQDSTYLFCCGLAMGLSIGCKMTAMPAAALIFLCCVIGIWRTEVTRARGENGVSTTAPASAWGKVALLSVSALCGCLYWLLRNAVLHGNPFYPVAFAGLPGYSMVYLAIQNPDFAAHPWKVLTYPWAEWGYSNVFDQGTGAVFAAIVIPLALWWPIHMIRGRKFERNSLLRWLLYCTTVALLVYYVSQKTMASRYGMVGIVLSFLLVGEAWTFLRSASLRVAVLVAYALMFIGLSQAFVGGVAYRLAWGLPQGAARYSMPPEVDRMPPDVILNAVSSNCTYGLMGSDYRHDVITLFRQAEPHDVTKLGARVVYLREADFPAFNSALSLETIARSESDYGEKFALCRVGEAGDRRVSKPVDASLLSGRKR